MNVRLRKKVLKIVNLCMDAKDLGHDCFFNNQSHVQEFSVRCYLDSWAKGKESIFKKDLYLDNDNAVDELNEIIDFLEELIEKSL